MRALIIISASRAMVMDPSRNCRDEFLDQVLAAFSRGGLHPEPPLVDDLVQQADISWFR